MKTIAAVIAVMLALSQSSRAAEQDFPNEKPINVSVQAQPDERSGFDLSKLSRPDVRQFAQQVEGDSKTFKQAKDMGIELPKMADDTASLKARLEKLDGASRDASYLDTTIKEYEQAILQFERVSKTGPDAEAKAFATREMQGLKERLAMARLLAE